MAIQIGSLKSFVTHAKTLAHDFSHALEQEYHKRCPQQSFGHRLITDEEQHLMTKLRAPDMRQQLETALMTLGEHASESMYDTIEFTRERISGKHFFEKGRRTRAWQQSLKAPPRIKRNSFGYTERDIDIRIYLLLTAVGIDMLGIVVFPPLRLLTLPLIFANSAPFFKNSWTKLVYERKIDVGVITCVTILATVVTGHFGLSIVTGMINSLAFKLQFRIMNNAQSQLVNVFSQQPHSVYTLVDGVEVRIPFADVQRGDIVLVQTGDIIPVDGIILAGSASIDQHMLTGESQPAEKGVGEHVFAATLVLAGSLQIEAEQTGKETTVAQIGHILNTTISSQTTMQLRAEEMANSTVPPTLLLSVLTMLVLGSVPGVAVVASHFGLRMSIVAPLVVLSYFRILSQRQVLMKDGRMLDMLRDVDTVVFDKTGTLTMYQPHVGRIYAWNGASDTDILAWAAAAEVRQSHPIARAIVEAATERHIPLPLISNLSYEVGYGLAFAIDDTPYAVGSSRFMETMNIPLLPHVADVEQASHHQGHSLVVVAQNQCVVGAIELVPTVRPEVPHIVAGLRQRGIKHLVIISGDHEAPTRKLAYDLGMDEYFAATLPQNKAAIIQQLQMHGRHVCYVGDGINDAIALKHAHVSVSLRGASSIATDTAQIVLLEGGLEQFCHLFDVARDFDLMMKVCFALVLAPCIVGMGGVWLLNFGLTQAILIKQLSLLLGASGAMVPLVRAYLMHAQETTSRRGRPEMSAHHHSQQHAQSLTSPLPHNRMLPDTCLSARTTSVPCDDHTH